MWQGELSASEGGGWGRLGTWTRRALGREGAARGWGEGGPTLGRHEPGVCQAAGTEAGRAQRLPRADREVQGRGSHWLEKLRQTASPRGFYESG